MTASRNETRWTPGPWKHVAVAGGWDGVADSEGALICRLALNEPRNATLIAAAPDFAEAAATLISRHDDHAKASGFAKCGCDDCNPFRAALSRATGDHTP